jgi:hypothetical protein
MSRRILKHLAFASIGVGLIAELMTVIAITAASDSAAGMWTTAPLYQVHFAVIAAYSSLADYAAQFLSSLHPASVAADLTAAVTVRLQDLFSFKIELAGSEITVALFGR